VNEGEGQDLFCRSISHSADRRACRRRGRFAENADDVPAYTIHQQGCAIEVATSFSDFLAKLVVYDDDGSINVSIRRPLA
jgi:hypothetical protein